MRRISLFLAAVLTVAACTGSGGSLAPGLMSSGTLAPYTSNFQGQIRLGPVESTLIFQHEAFEDALRLSLADNGLISATSQAPYELSVELKELEESEDTGQKKANALISYKLVRVADGSIVFFQELNTSEEKTVVRRTAAREGKIVGASIVAGGLVGGPVLAGFILSDRQRKAAAFSANQAISENIRAFIRQLSTVPIPNN